MTSCKGLMPHVLPNSANKCSAVINVYSTKHAGTNNRLTPGHVVNVIRARSLLCG